MKSFLAGVVVGATVSLVASVVWVREAKEDTRKLKEEEHTRKVNDAVNKYVKNYQP